MITLVAEYEPTGTDIRFNLFAVSEQPVQVSTMQIGLGWKNDQAELLSVSDLKDEINSGDLSGSGPVWAINMPVATVEPATLARFLVGRMGWQWEGSATYQHTTTGSSSSLFDLKKLAQIGDRVLWAGEYTYPNGAILKIISVDTSLRGKVVFEDTGERITKRYNAPWVNETKTYLFSLIFKGTGSVDLTLKSSFLITPQREKLVIDQLQMASGEVDLTAQLRFVGCLLLDRLPHTEDNQALIELAERTFLDS